MFKCLIHLKPHEVERVRRQTGGMVSPWMLLESQATIPEEAVMLFRGKISYLFFTGKTSFLPKLIFGCPLTMTSKHIIGARGKKSYKKGFRMAPLPGTQKPGGAAAVMLVNADRPEHSLTSSRVVQMVLPCPTCSPDAFSPTSPPVRFTLQTV